jgi:hypothetical protein
MSSAPPQKPAPAPKPEKSGDWFKPTGIAAGILIFLAGMMTFSAGVSAAPGEKAHQDFVTGLIVLGGAFGIIAAALGWFDHAPAEAAVSVRLFYGVAAAAGAGIIVFIRRCGMHQIGGFDHSVLVDVGWRLFNGQRAYVDFPCTLPVAFILGAKFAYQWFGVYWRSFVDMTALFALVTFGWSLFLLVALFGRRWPTLLWAIALQAISLMLASYWWYNPITAVTAVLYLLAAEYWLHRPDARGAVVSYGLALLAIATMKPNVAGVVVPLISIILFCSPRHRWKTLLISAGALAAFLIFLTINHLSFTGMLKGYLSVAQRGASLQQFMLDLNSTEKRAAFAMVGIVVLPLAIAFFQGRRALLSRRPLMALVALIGGLYGFITNAEQKLVDMPLVLFGAILLVAELRNAAILESGTVFSLPAWWSRYLTWVCVILAAGGIAQGLARDRIKVIGMQLFFEFDDSKHVMESGFFQGVHCGDVFYEVNLELAELLRRESSSTLCFGPRLQWAYAAYDKSSPRGQPIWWHPGVSFATGEQDVYFDRFLESRAVFVLIKNDVLWSPSYYTEQQARQLAQRYSVDQSFPLLTILRPLR